MTSTDRDLVDAYQVPDHGHGTAPRRQCPHPDCLEALRIRRHLDREHKRRTITTGPDGREWQTDPECPHGTVGGYDNWLCRCWYVPGSDPPEPGCAQASAARRTTN